MDKLGIFRRLVGLGGVALIYLGVSSQGDVDTATQSIETIIGSGMVLLDFGKSLYNKIFPK